MEVALIDNRIGISAGWLMRVCGLNYNTYKSMVRRKQLTLLSRGGGKDRCAVIQWSNLPERFRTAVLLHGDPEKAIGRNLLDSYLRPDAAAREFFSCYFIPYPNGDVDDEKRNLPPDTQFEYCTNAEVLNAVGGALRHRKALARACSGSVVGDYWDRLSDAVNSLDRKAWKHTLPTTARRLRDKYTRYVKDGYISLVHSNFNNQTARKVDELLKRLILSLYCRGNKPYGKWVHEDYLLFLSGGLEIVNTETGELFDREDFYDEKRGEYKMVSEATIWNYINNPLNRAIVDSIRMGYHKFGSEMRPHYHRSYGKYSLSKVSMDDRDLPRKLHNGNRVKAYYAYDVVSGCLIGAAYSRKKDCDLFIDCMRDMFRFIDCNGLGIPMEAEVENHLVRKFEDDLMKAGVVFPFVRFCAPTNSQEKHAEQFNKQKKYGYEKRYQDGIGRFYLKDKSNQTNGERVYDEATDRYIIKEKTYDYDQLVADDRATIIAYNNGLHRDQKRFPGKSRLEVLNENLNPDLVAYNRPLLARYIGEVENTSIRRNMYCRVQFADYMLPTADVLARMAPGNYNVQAYYLPYGANMGEIYLYQNDNYLCTAAKIEKFTTAQAEWTEEDDAAMTAQAKYISHFDALVRRGRAEKVARVEAVEADELEALTSPASLPSPQRGETAHAGEFAHSLGNEWERRNEWECEQDDWEEDAEYYLEHAREKALAI